MVPRTIGGWSGMGAGLWGMLAGLVGSLCCVGPSAAILLGMGASSALFGFHVEQRLALGAGGVLLLIGGVVAWRRTRTCALGSRTGWQQFALLVATSALVYGLLGIAAPWAAARQEDVAAPRQGAAVVAPPTLHQATLLVAKMECPPCVAHLHSLLARMPFVVQAVVENGNEQIVIVYDSRQVTVDNVLARIPGQYDAQLLTDAALP